MQKNLNAHFEHLFVLTLNELDRLNKKRSAFSTLRASAILRQLLIDSPSLLDLANRQLRSKVSFRAANSGVKYSVYTKTHEYSLWTTHLWPISDEMINEGFLSFYNLKQFLKLPIFGKDHQAFTVKDLIRTAANLKGGVHYDSSTDKEISELTDLLEQSSIYINVPIYIDCIHQISNITVHALSQLSNVIIEKHRQKI